VQVKLKLDFGTRLNIKTGLTGQVKLNVLKLPQRVEFDGLVKCLKKRSFYENVSFNFSVKDRGHTEPLVDEACLIGFTGLPRQFADS
jgi:hypothetical protein